MAESTACIAPIRENRQLSCSSGARDKPGTRVQSEESSSSGDLGGFSGGSNPPLSANTSWFSSGLRGSEFVRGTTQGQLVTAREARGRGARIERLPIDPFAIARDEDTEVEAERRKAKGVSGIATSGP